MLHAEESRKYQVLSRLLPRDEAEFDDELLSGFYAIGLNKTLEWFIYAVYADRENTLEAAIDLSDISTELPSLTRKELASTFKKLGKLGLIEVLHSSNWKHHHVLIHPIKKVLEKRKK